MPPEGIPPTLPFQPHKGPRGCRDIPPDSTAVAPPLWIIRIVPQRTWHRFAHHHYLPHLPGPNRCTYLLQHNHPVGSAAGDAGIALFTIPPISSSARNRVFGPLFRPSFTSRRTAARLAQAMITTLSRLVILPAYRQRGLAADFLKATSCTFATPIVEAHTIIGRSLSFFPDAGFTVIPALPTTYTLKARQALRDAAIPIPTATNAQALRAALRSLALSPRHQVLKALLRWHQHHRRGPCSGTVSTDLASLLSDVAMNLYQTTWYAYRHPATYLSPLLVLLTSPLLILDAP